MTKRYCTVPAIFGLRDWFEKNFGTECAEHDADYIEQNISRKQADRKMREGMSNKGYPVFAKITYYGFLRPLGWLWWNDIIGGDNTKKEKQEDEY